MSLQTAVTLTIRPVSGGTPGRWHALAFLESQILSPTVDDGIRRNGRCGPGGKPRSLPWPPHPRNGLNGNTSAAVPFWGSGGRRTRLAAVSALRGPTRRPQSSSTPHHHRGSEPGESLAVSRGSGV